MRYNDGFLVATGSARNVELGFVPSYVRVVNYNATEEVFEAAIQEAIKFDSGGNSAATPREITAGMRVDASDGGWSGTVRQVILEQGSWTGGDAQGWIVFEPGSLDGASNIADNDTIYASDQADLAGSEDHGTVNGAGLVTLSVKTDASAFGLAGSNEDIVAYYGSQAEDAKGFTIGSAVGADNDLLYYQAWSPDPGSDAIDLSDG